MASSRIGTTRLSGSSSSARERRRSSALALAASGLDRASVRPMNQLIDAYSLKACLKDIAPAAPRKFEPARLECVSALAVVHPQTQELALRSRVWLLARASARASPAYQRAG